MTRRTILAVGAFLLVAFGWAVGRAQTPAPEFTLAIEAPGGRTTVKCVRGCTLQGGQDEGNPSNRPTPKYWFECSGVTQCSATVNGWLKH
jgi:hypothetical protein